MNNLVLILDNIRSCYNVGSIFRTADGLGVSHIYLSGYTPYPLMTNDERLPHIAVKLDKSIAKTSLGAEKYIEWTYSQDVKDVILKLKNEGFTIICLEQTPNSVDIKNLKLNSNKIALVLGNEVLGVDDNIIQLSDICLEIPMKGRKESFNVSVAAAIACYELI